MSDAEGDVSAGLADRSRKLSDLVFHEDFAKAQPGDVILQAKAWYPVDRETRPGSRWPGGARSTGYHALLQADGEEKLYFYFRLARLAELSSFFSGLPSPSPDDMVEGMPLIPLHDSSSGGLSLVLAAVRSITESAIFVLPRRIIIGGNIAKIIEGVLDAAVLAQRCDLPIVFRILVEGIQGDPVLSRIPFLEFAIWAISGIAPKIAQAGEETVDQDITLISKPISSVLSRNAAGSWMKLQDLHLRRSHGLERFHAQIVRSAYGGCWHCTSASRGDVNWDEEVEGAFKAATSLEQLYDAVEFDQSCGVSCGNCVMQLQEDFAPKMAWIRDFTSKYDFDAEYEDYARDGQGA